MNEIIALLGIAGVSVLVFVCFLIIVSLCSSVSKYFSKILHRESYEERQNRVKKIDGLILEFRNKYQNVLGNTYLCESLRKKVYDDFQKIHLEIAYTDPADYSTEFKALIDKFEDIGCILRNVDGKLDKYNQDYVKKEIEATRNMLSDVDGRSLDEAQRTAVVTDEDSNLVIAGAGSGKTLTIVGKIKYLIERKHIRPEDILLLSFTGKVVDEMKARVQGISDKLVVQTFHKLGCGIISKNQQIDVFDSDDFSQFIKEYLNNDLVKNKTALNEFIKFFAFFLHIPPNKATFKTLGEAYEQANNVDFETMQSKYLKSLGGKNVDKRTLHGETVKSIEELIIANFLFLNGIEYEYEKEYPFQSQDRRYKKYRPDFYLVEKQIWLEHFGINEVGEAPWLGGKEKEYLEGIRWKREWHRQNGTRLVETYSWYTSWGKLLEKLKEIIIDNGIEIKPVDYAEVFEKIYQNSDDIIYKDFIDLCKTFVALFKSKGHKLDDLDGLDVSATDKFSKERAEVFKTLIRPVVKAYHDHLEKSGKIDFSDMILKATEYVKQGQPIDEYKYIVVDEFQDMSVAKMQLIKAIIDRTNAHLLCVGDDWQSIYRFTGSDLDIFTNFDKHFGKTAVMKIEKTYRNSQELLDVSAKFIQKNPKQIKKNLYSEKRCVHPVTFFMHKGNSVAAVKKVMNELIEQFGDDSSIMLLSRTNKVKEILVKYGLFSTKNHKSSALVYVENPKVKCSFHSIHSSKGLEADNVVLLNFDNSYSGIPNKMEDDPLLTMVLSVADSYPFGEERRLMYVALTRTRNKVVVITDDNRPSLFFHDFEEEIKKGINAQKLNYSQDGKFVSVKCPKCGGHLLEKERDNGDKFVGCSNYPSCRFTCDDLSILVGPKICPVCGGYMIRKKGPYSIFYGCINYPNCEHSEKIEK